MTRDTSQNYDNDDESGADDVWESSSEENDEDDDSDDDSWIVPDDEMVEDERDEDDDDDNNDDDNNDDDKNKESKYGGRQRGDAITLVSYKDHICLFFRLCCKEKTTLPLYIPSTVQTHANQGSPSYVCSVTPRSHLRTHT